MASNMNRRNGGRGAVVRPQAPSDAVNAFSSRDDDDPFGDIPSNPSPSPRRQPSRPGSSVGGPSPRPSRNRSQSGSAGGRTHRPSSGSMASRPASRPGGASSRLPSDLRDMDMGDGSVASFRATDMPRRPAKRHNMGMRVQRGQLADMEDDEEEGYTGIRGWFGHDPEHTMLMLSGGSYKGNSLWDWVRLIVLWMNYHKLIIVFISAMFVLIGFLFNKYIAVGWAFADVVLGVILSQMGDEYDEMVFYFSAMLSFIIPFLW